MRIPDLGSTAEIHSAGKSSMRPGYSSVYSKTNCVQMNGTEYCFNSALVWAKVTQRAQHKNTKECEPELKDLEPPPNRSMVEINHQTKKKLVYRFLDQQPANLF